jgi:AcrR family transcriptional regulator
MVMTFIEKKRSDGERAQNRRRQVLDAAEICFGSSGFHGASMAEISKAAGMSAGHIYNYFDGKDAIIAAFVQQNVERVSMLMHDLRQKEDPLQAVLDDIDQNVINVLQPGVWKLPLEIWAEASRNPAIAAMAQQADLHSRTELRGILQLGRARRGWATDEAVLEARIEVMIALFQGLQSRIVLNPGLDAAKVIDAMRLAISAVLMLE